MNGAVITALNEVDTVGHLIGDLQKQGLEVCVIDDGSTDYTGQVADEWGAHVIRHDTPQGIGKSLLDAWRYAIEQGWEYTVQIDAGGSHRAKDSRTLLGYFQDFPADLIIGSRFFIFGGDGYIGGSWWRKLGSRITTHALNFATHQRITDWTSGYRCFSRKALQALVDVHYMTNMHTWQIEVLHEAIKCGLTIAEVPITYKAGRSTLKWQTIDDLIKVYLVIFFAVLK